MAISPIFPNDGFECKECNKKDALLFAFFIVSEVPILIFFTPEIGSPTVAFDNFITIIDTGLTPSRKSKSILYFLKTFSFVSLFCDSNVQNIFK